MEPESCTPTIDAQAMHFVLSAGTLHPLQNGLHGRHDDPPEGRIWFSGQAHVVGADW